MMLKEMINIEQLREKLRHHLPAEEDKQIRKQIKKHAAINYSPNHTDTEYMDFVVKHLPSFGKVGSQNTNYPYVFELFTVEHQYMYGDSIKECIDKAIGKSEKTNPEKLISDATK